MKWVNFTDRKPPKDGWYFWKGKNNLGGYNYYYTEDYAFDFAKDIAVNHVSEHFLMWLEEY